MSTAKFHVFLSHNSSDKPAVEALAQRLKAEGLESWLDKWHLVPGEPWQQAIEQALEYSSSVAVFVGPSGFGPWQNEEMRAALARRVSQSDGQFRVIPVLLPGATREERSRLPSFLIASTWVEFRKSIDDEEAFRRLTCGILGQAPGISPDETVFEGHCPYRGLQAFQPEHAPFFFGREARIEWMLNTLRLTPASAGAGSWSENRFLGIIGASGSGKSSLARAGLIPALRHGRIEGSADWPIIICRPGHDPLESLAVALAAEPKIGSRIGDVGDLIKRMEADENRLHLTTRVALGDGPESQRIVVVIDQFEEVFTLQTDNRASIRASQMFRNVSHSAMGMTRRQAFINNLIYAAGIAGGKTIVVLTVRADFYGKCAAFSNLAAALPDHQELVGPMSREELREVIERPAQLVGLELERGLTEMLLNEMEDQPGALPLLQHALLELWQRREGRKLTIAAYQSIGGLEGALEQQANSIFNGMSVGEQETCRRIFLRLTQPGEGSEDTKCRVTMTQLGDSAAVSSVIDRLTNVRLITAEKGAFVEVSHEALIRSWSKLRSWIEADREALRTQHRLTEAAAEWDQSGRDIGYLYHGARLAETEEWSKTPEADLTRVEQEFLSASVEVRDSAKREEELRQAREIETLKDLADSEVQRAGDQALAAQRSKHLSRIALGLAAAAILACLWAIKSQHDAILNAEQAHQSATQAREARAKIEDTLAENLLKRIHLRPDEFGSNEFEGFWQLAAMPDEQERLRSLMLSIGLRDPVDYSVRLANRAPIVTWSLVGLNDQRRQKFLDELLMPVLGQQPAAPQSTKLAAVRMGIALMKSGREFADHAVRTLSMEMVQCRDARVLDSLTDELKLAVKLFPEAESTQAIHLIVSAMEQTGEARVLRRLCEAAGNPPGKMSVDDRKRLADRLFEVLEHQTRPDVIRELTGCLAAFPREMKFIDAARVVKSVVAAVENSSNRAVHEKLAEAMEMVAVRLRPAECQPAAEEILRAMKAAEDSGSVQVLARCLNSVAIHRAETDVADGASIILAGMQVASDADPLHELTLGLGHLGGNVSERDGRTAIGRLLQVMMDATASSDLRVLAKSLAAVPVKLSKEDVQKSAKRILERLTEVITPYDQQELAKGLAELPGKLSDEESRSALDRVLATFAKVNKEFQSKASGGALFNLCGKLTPVAAEGVAEAILAAIATSRDSEKILALCHGLRGMDAAISEATVTKAYELVQAKLTDPDFALPSDQGQLVECIAVLPPISTEALVDKAINRLLGVLVATKNSDVLQFLVDRMGQVGKNLSMEGGHTAITTITATIRKTRDTGLWRILALGLASVSVELDRTGKFTDGDAPDVSIQLSWAMDATTDPIALARLASALATISAKLPATATTMPNEQQLASRTVIQQIFATIQATNDPAVIAELARCWTVMAGRMTESETREAFDQILVAHRNPENVLAMPALFHAAVALAMASNPGREKDPLGNLLLLLDNDHNPEVLRILLDGIEKLAPMVFPSDAAFFEDRIIAVTRERNRMNDQVMNSLTRALDALPGDVDKLKLVELLKCPICTFDSRQTVLTMIESQTNLKFNGDPWKLVAMAKEAGIDPEVFRRPVRLPALPTGNQDRDN